MAALSRRQFLWGAVLLMASGSFSVRADADGIEANEGDEIPGHDEAHEHEYALDSVTAGKALPLIDIVAETAKTVPGQLLEAKLRKRDGKLVYVLTILSETGIYSLVIVDAKANEILAVKEK